MTQRKAHHAKKKGLQWIQLVVIRFIHAKKRGAIMGKAFILWLLGVPFSLLIILWLFGVFR